MQPKLAIAQVHPNTSTVNGYNGNLPEMNEPFPPELDFSQVINNNQSVENIQSPPPPPPRDPKKRLYLSNHPNSLNNSAMELRRPVSYSFENVSSASQNLGHLHLNPTIVANDQNQLHRQLNHDLSNGIPPISYNLPESNHNAKYNPYNEQNDAPPLPQRRRIPSASPSNRSNHNFRSHSSENHKSRKATNNKIMSKTKSSQNINTFYNDQEKQSFAAKDSNHQLERKFTNRPRSNLNFSTTISNHLVNTQNRSKSNIPSQTDLFPTESVLCDWKDWIYFYSEY
jgi:hypothetical protein